MKQQHSDPLNPLTCCLFTFIFITLPNLYIQIDRNGRIPIVEVHYTSQLYDFFTWKVSSAAADTVVCFHGAVELTL